MNVQELLQEYPPQVYNPIVGKKVLVRWHSEDEGHHVIISDDMQGALETYQFLAKEYDDIVVKEYLEAELIPCPLPIAERWAKEQLEDDQESYGRQLLSNAYELPPELMPPEIGVCHHKDKDDLWDCEKCDGLGVLLKVPVSEMFKYREVREAWQAEHPKPETWTLPDNMPETVPDNLMCAFLDSGHHHPGIYFASGWGRGYSFHKTLFFFKVLSKREIPECFLEIAETREAAKVKDELEWVRTRELHEKEQQDRRIQALETTLATYRKVAK